MPISGTSTDYSNRTKDLHIFQGVNPNKLANISPSIGRISNYCSGIQKLIQRYAIALLTEITSQPNYLTFGTNLISRLTNSSSRINKADVYPIFNAANSKVITLFKTYQQSTPGLPKDEQLATAQLLDIKVVGDTISLSVQIYPVSTAPILFLLPIPTK
jgi:hypothetical protein